MAFLTLREGVDLQVQIILEHNMHVITDIVHSDCRIADGTCIRHSLRLFSLHTCMPTMPR
jgi:hypothetical protein